MQIVRASVQIAMIIHINARSVLACIALAWGATKINTQEVVGKDGIAPDNIAGEGAAYRYPIKKGTGAATYAVKSDNIARARRGAPNRLIVVAYIYAIQAIAEVSGSIHVRADVIALDHNVCAREIDAVVTVGGDDVARVRSCAADGVHACGLLEGEDLDADARVAQRRLAGDVRADIVALDQIARCRGNDI